MAYKDSLSTAETGQTILWSFSNLFSCFILIYFPPDLLVFIFVQAKWNFSINFLWKAMSLDLLNPRAVTKVENFLMSDLFLTKCPTTLLSLFRQVIFEKRILPMCSLSQLFTLICLGMPVMRSFKMRSRIMLCLVPASLFSILTAEKAYSLTIPFHIHPSKQGFLLHAAQQLDCI